MKSKLEKRKRYNFSIRPSVRAKALSEAYKKGLSLSAFVESLIISYFCKD